MIKTNNEIYSLSEYEKLLIVNSVHSYHSILWIIFRQISKPLTGWPKYTSMLGWKYVEKLKTDFKDSPDFWYICLICNLDIIKLVTVSNTWLFIDW